MDVKPTQECQEGFSNSLSHFCGIHAIESDIPIHTFSNFIEVSRFVSALDLSVSEYQTYNICNFATTYDAQTAEKVFCIKSWTNMWRCRWISWIWFWVTYVSKDPLINKDSRYLVVLQLSFRNPLLQELLLNGTHFQTPSPHWLQYHPSEAICLLHHTRRHAHSIAKISVSNYYPYQIQIPNLSTHLLLRRYPPSSLQWTQICDFQTRTRTQNPGLTFPKPKNTVYRRNPGLETLSPTTHQPTSCKLVLIATAYDATSQSEHSIWIPSA